VWVVDLVQLFRFQDAGFVFVGDAGAAVYAQRVVGFGDDVGFADFLGPPAGGGEVVFDGVGSEVFFFPVINQNPDVFFFSPRGWFSL